jgi:tetratricopeptide (TPR) repeat protein
MHCSRLFILVFLFCLKGISQVRDSAWSFSPDSLFLLNVNVSSYAYSYCPDVIITHSADSLDSVICKTSRGLTEQIPNKNNYNDYYELARALWEMNETNEAEKMFLVIVNSGGAFYTDSYYHSSDIPGDTTKNLYGYGSYTSNYKHYACAYLTKTYIERKEFKKALQYLHLADKKYPLSYSCGTAHMYYKAEMYGLYALCYEDLGQDAKTVKLLLPDCFHSCTASLARALQRMYPGRKMDEQLASAIQSLKFVQDEKESLVSRYGADDRGVGRWIEYKVLSGTATVVLFGYKIELPRPILEAGQVATREQFIANMKKTDFYMRLKGELD